MDRADEAFNALLWLPWVNLEDQYMFYITVTHMMPESRIAIRHIQEETMDKKQVQGFKITVSQKGIHWAVIAILLSTEDI